MTFGQAIPSCMGKYATFSGRASRSEFWWFYLFTTLMYWGAQIAGYFTFPFGSGMGEIISFLVSLVFLLPGLAAGSRRLHDTGRSGWWQLLWFTIIGIILLIIWWAQDTRKEAYRYGDLTTRSNA